MRQSRFGIGGAGRARTQPDLGRRHFGAALVPDSLRWEALGVGHSTWLAWLVSGALDEFYADLRWPGWKEEVRALNSAQGLTLSPPMWSAEAHAGCDRSDHN